MIFLYELKKILIKQYSLLLYLIVIIFAAFSLITAQHQTYGFATVTERNEYLETITPFTGELTDEKAAEITALKEEYLAAKAAVNELSNKYANGELDDAAFEREMAQYNEILKREEIIEQIFSRYEYAAADPEKRMLIPAGSVPVLSDTSVNFLFLLCITFCCACLISSLLLI